MSDPMGEHGGVVLREFRAFGEDLEPGHEIPSHMLLEAPLPNRLAWASTGLIRFHSLPSGADAGSGEIAEAVKQLAFQVEALVVENVKLNDRLKTLRSDVGHLKAAAKRKAKK